MHRKEIIINMKSHVQNNIINNIIIIRVKFVIMDNFFSVYR